MHWIMLMLKFMVMIILALTLGGCSCDDDCSDWTLTVVFFTLVFVATFWRV
jgi:hypothetical protein